MQKKPEITIAYYCWYLEGLSFKRAGILTGPFFDMDCGNIEDCDVMIVWRSFMTAVTRIFNVQCNQFLNLDIFQIGNNFCCLVEQDIRV